MNEIKQDDIMRIALKGKSRQILFKIAQEFQLDVSETGGVRQQPDGSVRIEAYLPQIMLKKLKQSGVEFEFIENATEVGRERQKEVGRGDRFEGGKIAPSGLGRKE